MSQYQTTGFINQPSYTQQQQTVQQPPRMNFAEMNLRAIYSACNSVYQKKQAQGLSLAVLQAAANLFQQNYMNGVIAQQVASTYASRQLQPSEAEAIADRFFSMYVNQVISQSQGMQSLGGYTNPHQMYNQTMYGQPQPVYQQQPMMQQPMIQQPMVPQPVQPMYGQQQTMYGQPVYQQPVVQPTMYGQPVSVYGQVPVQPIVQNPMNPYRQYAQVPVQPVYSQQIPQSVNNGGSSVYRRHKQGMMQNNAAPTPTIHTPKNPATYTSMPPLSQVQQSVQPMPQPQVAPKPAPKKDEGVDFSINVNKNYDYQRILDNVTDELKQYLTDEEPVQDVQLLQCVVTDPTGKDYTVDSVSTATLNLKWPVNSVEQAVADAFDGMENLLATGSTNVKKFGHVVNAKVMESIRMPYERAKEHFDSVMKVVNDYDKRKIDINITSDEGEVLQTVVNPIEYYKYVSDVLTAIKRCGGPFLTHMEKKIVHEFNQAAQVFLTTEAKVNGCYMTAKFHIDSLDEFGDILRNRITEAADDVSRFWQDDYSLLDSIRATLDASLFAIFRRGEVCYMDIEKGEDVSTVYMSAKVGLKSFGQPTRYGFATFSEQPDFMTSDMLKKVKNVFVYTIARSILVHNFDVDPVVPYTDDYDFTLKTYKPSTATKMLGRMLVNIDDDNASRRSLLAVKYNQPELWSTPAMFGVSYNMKLLSKRIMA